MDVKRVLLVDVGIFVVYALAANPAVTGVPVHEWLGIGALVVVVVHTAMHLDWLVDTFRTAPHRRGTRLAKALLDLALVTAFMLCTVSGIMVSGTVLQGFGLYADGYYFWDPLHAASAKALLALLLMHVASNWKIITTVLKKKGVDRGE